MKKAHYEHVMQHFNFKEIKEIPLQSCENDGVFIPSRMYCGITKQQGSVSDAFVCEVHDKRVLHMKYTLSISTLYNNFAFCFCRTEELANQVLQYSKETEILFI